MPAKKRNESRFKPFLGRVFTLRQHKNMSCYYNNKERIHIDLKELGDVVLVFDETNTRVKVPLINGTFVWIPKFYLHKEIKNSSFDKNDNLSFCIEQALQIESLIRDNDQISFSIKKKVTKKIKNIVRVLRKHADANNPILTNEDDKGNG